jgi:preprotein translocase subunit SecF
MSKEVPLQVDMFSGELVDTRTRKQKKQEQERQKPMQTAMFSQREMAQFGVRAHPQIPLSAKTRIELALQDVRTEEEKEEARRREIERRSYRLPGFEEELGAGPAGDESRDSGDFVDADLSEHGQ